jgi:hypothetical protein
MLGAGNEGDSVEIRRQHGRTRPGPGARTRPAGTGRTPSRRADDELIAELAPGAAILRPADAAALQRLAGNAATTARIRGGAAAVQRLDIYGRTAAQASALGAETARAFRRLIDAGDQAGALRVVVEAMSSRGQLDPRLLRTSGEGELWQIRDVPGFRAQANFRSSFADPDTPGRRLPNPRFTISSTALRADGLDDLYTSILHEYRHVEQESEQVNSTTPREQTFGYGADPDEFDAYLSEVEFSYRREHMRIAALQAGVHWEFLSEANRAAFLSRWTAAQAKIQRVLGQPVSDVVATPTAEAYRQRLREMERSAREAWERAGGGR